MEFLELGCTKCTIATGHDQALAAVAVGVAALNGCDNCLGCGNPFIRQAGRDAVAGLPVDLVDEGVEAADCAIVVAILEFGDCLIQLVNQSVLKIAWNAAVFDVVIL